MPRVFLKEVEREALRFYRRDQIRNVLGSLHIVWHAVIPLRFDIVPMSLVCCLLTKPGLIFATVRSLSCIVGEDNALPSAGQLRSIASDILSALHIQTF